MLTNEGHLFLDALVNSIISYSHGNRVISIIGEYLLSLPWFPPCCSTRIGFLGKTTILYRLKLDEFINAVTTIGFNAEKVRARTGKSKGVRFRFWDAGGSEKLRPLWKSYTRATDAIVFVVDSSDTERFEEAKSELLKLARSPKNSGVPILVIANKQDLREAVSPEEIERLLSLKDLRQHNPYQIIPACGITGEGLVNVFDILCEMIDKRRILAKQRKTRRR